MEVLDALHGFNGALLLLIAGIVMFLALTWGSPREQEEEDEDD